MKAPLSLRTIAVLLLAQPLPGQTPAPRIETPLLQTNPAVETPEAGSTIRIATWTVEWFPAARRNGTEQNVQWQTAAAANIVQELKPDILALQQIKDAASVTLLNKNLGPAGFAQGACTLYEADNKNPPKTPAKLSQESALLSRFPWTETHEVDFATLPAGPNHPVRGWLAAHFAIKGLSFTLFNGHLAAGAPPQKPDDVPAESGRRQAAIDELKRELDRLNLDPYRDKIIVLGNFNSDLFDSAYQNDKTFKNLTDLGFQHSWGTHVRKETITRPAQSGGSVSAATFDTIWFSAAWGDNLPTAQVLAKGASLRSGVMGGDEPGLASDHYPVWVDIPVQEHK